MSPFDDFDPTKPNLNLSQAELESLHTSVGETLIRKGTIMDFNDMFPVSYSSEVPHAFVLQLDSEMVKQLFAPDDDELTPTGEQKVTYMMPHRVSPIEADPLGAVSEDVNICLSWQLRGTDILTRHYYFLTKNNGLFDGTFMTEYSQDGRRISPKGLPPKFASDLSPERIIELIDDIQDLERQLDMDDAERIRKLIDALSSNG